MRYGAIEDKKMKEKIIRTTCGICQIGCGALVHTKQGQITMIEGDPEHPLNKGVLCSKGLASLEYLHHPDRLRQPLKRAGKRGEGKWSPISWDEALSLTAGKFIESKERYGAESVAFMRGAAKGLQDDYLTRFANLFGSPNITSMAHVCFVPRKIASTMTYGYYAIPDFDHPPKCIIVWGNNVSDNLHHVYLRIKKAVNQGAYLIVVDPYKNKIAKMADLWVRLKPGEDLALALSILHVIIKESLYNPYFVDHYTAGFDELKDHVESYAPEKTADTTWVPQEIIRKIAKIYTENKPACIQWGNGIDHGINNFQTARAICIMRAITGNLGTPGGELQWISPPIMERGSPQFNQQDKISPEVRQKRIVGEERLLPTVFYALPQALTDAMLTGNPYPIKCAFIQGCNALLTYPNARKVYEALQNLDFMVVSDMFMTPTAMLADIALPVTTYLEFDSIVFSPYSHAVASVQQQVSRIPECRSDYEILRDLAIKIGFGEYFWKTEEECLDVILKPAGISFREFKNIAVLEGAKQYRVYEQKGFPTPSGKVELYSKRLKEWGFDPLPSYAENGGDSFTKTKPDEAYPLVLTSWKIDPYRHSCGRQITSLRKIHPEPLIIIHPETAKRNGITEGDSVVVETETGNIVQKAIFDNEIDSRIVGVDFAWWFPEETKDLMFGWDKSNINIIINDKPPFGKELGTQALRGIPCKIHKISAQRQLH